MLGDKIKIQSKVDSDYTDEQLLFVKQMGVKYVYVIFRDEHTDYDSVMRFMERLHKFDLTVTDAGNVHLYKNDKIIPPISIHKSWIILLLRKQRNTFFILCSTGMSYFLATAM